MSDKDLIAIVVADAHLDELIWRSRPEISGDAFFAFNKVMEVCANNPGTPLICLGDMVEALKTVPTTTTIRQMSEYMQMANIYGTEVLSIAGNHDANSPGYFHACGASEDNLDLQTKIIAGMRFFFIGNRNDTELTEVQSLVPEDTDVICAHQAWKELPGGIHSRSSISNFSSGKLLLTGDLHQCLETQVVLSSGDEMRVVSPGATHLRSVSEPHANFIGLLHSDLSISWKPIRGRVVMREEIDSEYDLEGFIQSLPEKLQESHEEGYVRDLPPQLITPLLIVRDSNWMPGVESRLRMVLGDSCHLFYYRSLNNSPVGEPQEEVYVSQQDKTAASLIPQLLAAETAGRQEVHDLLFDSLRSDSPQEVINKFRNQIITRSNNVATNGSEAG